MNKKEHNNSDNIKDNGDFFSPSFCWIEPAALSIDKEKAEEITKANRCFYPSKPNGLLSFRL